MGTEQDLEGRWALILGASSGFGAATARAMARAGMNIFGVHLDTGATLPRAREVIADIQATGHKAVYFNINAADEDRRTRTLDEIRRCLDGESADSIHFMLHSLAFGTLRPLIMNNPKDATTESQMEMTLRVMAHSLVYWTQGLVQRDLLKSGSRVYSLSSAGSMRVMKYYGAVSAAKAALESHTRQLALELGPLGICVNCLQPGVTDTPALRVIPQHEEYLERAAAANPRGRLTTTRDVANTLVALAEPRVTWINGAVIPVDGGELIVG